MTNPNSCKNCSWYTEEGCVAMGIMTSFPAQDFDYECDRYSRKVEVIDNHNHVGSPFLNKMAVIVDKETGKLMYKSYKIDGFWYAVDDKEYQEWFRENFDIVKKLNAEETIIAYLKDKGEIK